MQEEATLQKLDDEDMTDDERAVINHMMQVENRGSDFEGPCGKIKNIEFIDPETTDTPPQMSNMMDDLEKVKNDLRSSTRVSVPVETYEKLLDDIRRIGGLDADNKKSIAVTVELPDGEEFTDTFKAPRFQSEGTDNEFVRLYKEVLGHNSFTANRLIGEMVPVNIIDDTEGKYEIDTHYSESNFNIQDVNVSIEPLSIMSDITDINLGMRALMVVTLILATTLMMAIYIG